MAKENPFRSAARPSFDEGMAALTRAFNVSNDPSIRWSFSPEENEQVSDHLYHLMRLFLKGKIQANPAAALPALTNDDAESGKCVRTAPIFILPRNKR